MAKLVFDIETSQLPLEHFDEAQQEYLFRELEKMPEGPERETRRGEIHRQFNLWPFTAQVVCVAMLNADTARGQVRQLTLQRDPHTDSVLAHLPGIQGAQVEFDVTEAGGKVSKMDGSTFDVDLPNLLSSNGRGLHDELSVLLSAK